MAVVQISRIQVRRGKAQSGTGFPQLASGELGWALDSQELYIGNGSVAEGAPAVGNTKVITELDLGVNGNILNLLQYIYQSSNTGIITGPSANLPVARGINTRLDDQVNLNDFLRPEEILSNDYTAAIRRAILQLYLNDNISKASSNTFDAKKNRVVLTLPAGEFTITDTIYIPSYATLQGAGSDKTIINHTGTGPVFQFINDDSTANPFVVGSLSSTQGTTQPREIEVSGMSIVTSTTNQKVLILNAVKDSKFEDLLIKSMWSGLFNANSCGIFMDAKSSIVTCERNIFNNIRIVNFTYGVYAKADILNNTFTDVSISNVRNGFILGGDRSYAGDYTLPRNPDSEQYGPRETLISNCRFVNVKHQAILLYRGTGNTLTNLKLDNVGNNGGSHQTAVYPQIYIGEFGNTVTKVKSDRSYANSTVEGDMITPVIANHSPYYPEVTGLGTYESYGPKELQIGEISSFTTIMRLPVSTGYAGNPVGTIEYSIDYLYRSNNNGFTRNGQINVVAYVDSGLIQYSDDYSVAGITDQDSLDLEFKAILVDFDGVAYTGSPQTPYAISIQMKNRIIDENQGQFVYTYNSKFVISNTDQEPI